MKLNLHSFSVDGLFGHVSHYFEFNQEPAITILTGMNGAGKTHVLKLLKHTLALDLKSCLEIRFSQVTITYSNGQKLRFVQEESDGSVHILISVIGKGNRTLAKLDFSEEDIAAAWTRNFPEYIHKINDSVYFDARTERAISRDFVERRWGLPGDRIKKAILGTSKTMRSILNSVDPVLIDTKRLDTPDRTISTDVRVPRALRYSSDVRSPVTQYLEQVRSQVNESLSISLSTSQRADRNFAARALDSSYPALKGRKLGKLYEDLATLHAELKRNGLAPQSMELEIPDFDKLGDVESRILTLFLQDWRDKLDPLILVNNRLNALRKIVNNKFSGKHLNLIQAGRMAFISSENTDIPVDQLSSGEQHMLALFTMLLFSADSQSLILIDEPEISLHAAWKHDFLDDLEEVAALNDVTIVFATHSSAIVNGRWELVRELEGAK